VIGALSGDTDGPVPDSTESAGRLWIRFRPGFPDLVWTGA